VVAARVGAAPYTDSDPHGQIDRVFEMAREFDVDIDMHLDFGPTSDKMTFDHVCRRTEEYRYGGRVAGQDSAFWRYGIKVTTGGAIPWVSRADRSPRHCYHIVAARLQRSTKCPRVHRIDLTNFTKRSTLPLPRARPHELGESHSGVGGPGDGLFALGAVT
jgi:hypothetical protein